MKFVVFVIAAFLSLSAGAAGTTAVMSWLAPTAYTDGSPLPVTDIATYTIAQVSDAGVSKTTQVGGTAKTATISGLVCGKYALTIVVDTKKGTHSGPETVTYDTGIKCAPALPKSVGSLVAK